MPEENNVTVDLEIKLAAFVRSYIHASHAGDPIQMHSDGYVRLWNSFSVICWKAPRVGAAGLMVYFPQRTCFRTQSR